MDENKRPPLGETDISETSEIDISKIPSTVLARLIEEVRNEELLNTSVYNRTHNRHNRGR